MEKKAKRSDIDWGFILPSLIIVLAIAIPSVLWTDQVNTALNGFFGAVVTNAAWLIILVPAALLFVCFWWIISKYGNIVLGNPLEKPYMSNFTYFATITCTLYGSTIMRTASVQWAIAGSDPLFGVEPMSDQAMLQGQAYSMYLWSLPMAALYAAATPCLAYFIHNRKEAHIHCSKMCRDLFGDKFADGILGKIFDIVFILALVLGVAVFIGMAAPILSAILAKLMGTEASFAMDLGFTLGLIALFTTSVWRGMKRGIELLSRLNIYLLVIMIVFILITGPTLFILGFGMDTLGELVSDFPRLLFTTDAIGTAQGAGNSTVSYTVFWWAYCLSWCLIFSLFVAIISKGRTVKEMMIVFIITNCVAAIPVTMLLGGIGVKSQMDGLINMFVDREQGLPFAIANMLSVQNFAPILMVIFGLLTFTFLATTMDSSTYTLASFTSSADMSKHAPSKKLRLMWSFIMAGAALILMYLGGLGPLEAAAAIAGIPIIIISVILIFAGKKMMDNDKAYLNNLRPEGWDRATAPVAERTADDL